MAYLEPLASSGLGVIIEMLDWASYNIMILYEYTNIDDIILYHILFVFYNFL